MLKYSPLLLFTLIGLPLVFKPNEQKWEKRVFMHEKTKTLSKVADINTDTETVTVQLEYRISQNPSDLYFDIEESDIEENGSESVPNFEGSKSELDPDFNFRQGLQRNPLAGILGIEGVKELEINSLKSPFMISPQAYRYKGILKDSMESQKWSMEGIDILVFDIPHTFHVKDSDESEYSNVCQKWIKENLSKIKPIKDLELRFLLQNSSDKPFQVLNAFEILNLSKLELQIQFNSGESNYPMDIIAGFIKSQKKIEELIVYNSSVSLEMEEMTLFKDAIQVCQKLKKVLISFSDCSRIKEEKVLPLIQSIAALPLLKNVTIYLRNCAQIPPKFKETLLELFRTLHPAEITIDVTHDI